MVVNPVSLGAWVSLFMVYFLIDVLYAKYILAVQRSNAVWAANISVLTFVLAGYGTVEIVNNFLNIVPICFGAWCGTFLTVRNEGVSKLHKKKLSVLQKIQRFTGGQPKK